MSVSGEANEENKGLTRCRILERAPSWTISASAFNDGAPDHQVLVIWKTAEGK